MKDFFTIKMKIKLILFDFDGTIANSKKPLVKIFIKTINKHSFFLTKKQAEKLLGEKSAIIFKKLKISENKILQIRKEVSEEMKKVIPKIKPCFSLTPIKQLSKKYKLAIVTNAGSFYMRAMIKQFKLKSLFKNILTAEHFRYKEQALKQLFKKYKIKPQEAIFIGDRYSDVKAAKKAKCVSVAISNSCSFSSREVLLKQKPDFIIKNFQDLLKVVEKLNKN